MEREAKIARTQSVKVILNIAIVILCLITVACGFWAMHNLFDDYAWDYDEQSFYYRIEGNDLGAIVNMYYHNEAENVRANSSMKEYYGVAKYFEAASNYKAFLESGDATRAEREAAKMEEALPEMGGWGFLETEIQALLAY